MNSHSRFCPFPATASGLLVGSVCLQAMPGQIGSDHFKKTIDLVRSGKTINARTNAAEHLATLAKRSGGREFSETLVTEIISLLDSPDDSVRYWIAMALGYVGPAARSAIPTLLAMLPKAEKINGTITSADGIRFALTKMGVKLPPPGKESRIAG